MFQQIFYYRGLQWKAFMDINYFQPGFRILTKKLFMIFGILLYIKPFKGYLKYE